MTDHWSETVALPQFRQVELAAHAILLRKGEDVVVLDLRGRSDVTDYFLIASGGGAPQLGALQDGVNEALAGEGVRLLHVEGASRRSWILLDYVLVVHLMLPATREYYRLEALWNDAPRLELTAAYFHEPTVQARHPELTLVRLAGETHSEEP